MRPTSTTGIHYIVHDRLAVEVHETRESLGLAAARAAAAYIRDTTVVRGRARVIFACAPSQDDFLAALTNERATGVAVDWSKVTAFHMDEYVGLSAEDPRSFPHDLRTHLLNRINIGTFHPIEADRSDVANVCARYEELLSAEPIDLICLGIGENGHIAFNDPAVAEFDDERLVKEVVLDPLCRQQQVNDGCFASLDQVPNSAISLTIPVFRRARRLSVHVPGARKAEAIRAALEGEIGPECPASILRVHPHATLYIDGDAATRLST